MLREDATRASIGYPFAAGGNVWIADPHAALRGDADTAVWLETAHRGGEVPSVFAHPRNACRYRRARGPGARHPSRSWISRRHGAHARGHRFRRPPAPGDYVLALTLTDPGTGQSVTGRLPVQVQ